MLNLKVGMMPGKLTEVAIEEGTKVGEAFSIAGVSVDNHDVRLDGDKVRLDDEITSGSLLVATKQIKGNAGTIKVGMMPGKLTEVAYQGGETVGDLFRLADVSIDNHDVRLDGEKVSIDTVVNSGALLVATKQIKGNCDSNCGECNCEKVYIAMNLSEGEIAILLDTPLPTELSEDMVEIVGERFVEVKLGANEVYLIDEDMFNSVYELVSKDDIIEEVEDKIEPVTIAEKCEQTQQASGYPEGYENNIKILVSELKEQRDKYLTWAEQVTAQIDVLKELEFRTNN